MPPPNRILLFIVTAQFFCTSLWFAGNAVSKELILFYRLEQDALGHLTSAVQFGFISGTLIFALLAISDRFSPSRVFFFSALIGAAINALLLFDGHNFTSLLATRFFTGFCLAGIYPVGMKIAADYYEKGLGKALGFLVGALVLGTAFPHLLRAVTYTLPWKAVIIATSVLCLCGGSVILLAVGDGPFRKRGGQISLSGLSTLFKNKPFRAAAFGYFGHMWELYAFWAFVPLLVTRFAAMHEINFLNISLLSFIIIGVGGAACAASGLLSARTGVKNTARAALAISCICCLVSPLLFLLGSGWFFLLFMIIWGMAVVADSPLFSTLVAQNAPVTSKGTALTLVNCIGFSITIASIQLLNYLTIQLATTFIFMLLAVGPLLGLAALRTKKE